MALTWQVLKIGAGGFLTGGDIVSNGTTVARTDTYGAWYWNISTSTWIQLVTITSMPVADSGIDQQAGVYEIAIAPSNSLIAYMMYNGLVFRTANLGVNTTWTRTNFAHVNGCDANDQAGDNPRAFGRKMAIDPNNSDIVYMGTAANGLFVTVDAGSNWSTVTGVPTSLSNGGVIISFDPSSTFSGGKTQRIIASSYGNGVYETTNGGTSWAALSTSGMPTTHIHMVSDQAGTIYLTDNGGGATSLHKYESGAWSIPAGAGAAVCVAVDPADVNHITAQRYGGEVNSSANHGSTWTGYPNNFPLTTWAAPNIPWQAFAATPNGLFMSVGDIRFDPTGSNLLSFFEGIGRWFINPPSSGGLAWTESSKGIEQLVANRVICPPLGKPVVACWDRSFFYVSNPNTYRTSYGPNSAFGHGWDLAYPRAVPTTIIGHADGRSAKSTDGGQTWSAWAAYPQDVADGFVGGCIAASTVLNWVMVFSNNGHLFNTKDGGASWNKPTIGGSVGNSNWSFAFFLNRKIVCADGATDGKFYAYNNNDGLWVSTDQGDSWTLAFSGEIDLFSGSNAKLDSVPGVAGHLFFTVGQQGSPGDPNPANAPFKRSINAGVTWTSVPNVKEVYCFGWGAAASGASYPTLYIFGWVNNVLGIWRSTNADQATPTWTSISDGYPTGSFDLVSCMSGDGDVSTTCYAGFQGSGFVFGTESGNTGGFFVKTSGASSPRVLLFVRP